MNAPKTIREWFENQLHLKILSNPVGGIIHEPNKTKFINTWLLVKDWRQICIERLENGHIQALKAQLIKEKEYTRTTDTTALEFYSKLLQIIEEAEHLDGRRNMSSFIPSFFRAHSSLDKMLENVPSGIPVSNDSIYHTLSKKQFRRV
jgi:hypothetical protein